MSDDLNDFDDLRVVPLPLAIKIVGISGRTWERMEARGETPPKTQLSPHRIGYRVSDLKEWLDARRAAAS
jgi:predicted DNA-binding transcriptional regulator AlpA